MVGNSATVTLASFANRRATVSTETMEPQGEQKKAASCDEAKDDRKSQNSASSTWGLDAETKELPAPSQRKAIALDIPFYRTTAFFAK